MKYLPFLLLFISCVKSVPSKQSQQVTDPTENYQEDLSALRKSYETKAETKVEKEEEKPAVTLAFSGEEPKNDNLGIQKGLEKLRERNENLTDARGFRISIYSGNTRSDFEAAKSYILQNFPELDIYESYSQPTYKVKVGDFYNRLDAERYYANLVNRFSSAKIMADRINLKKSLNIKY